MNSKFRWLQAPAPKLNRHEEVARFRRPFRFLASSQNRGQIPPQLDPLLTVLPVLVSALPLAGSGAHAGRAPAFRQSFRNRSHVRHFATAQNPRDSCIAGAQKFCDSRPF